MRRVLLVRHCESAAQAPAAALTERGSTLALELVRASHRSVSTTPRSLALHSIDAGFGFSQWAALGNPDFYLLELDGGGRLTFRRVWR